MFSITYILQGRPKKLDLFERW